jgi:hypothetical protein
MGIDFLAIERENAIATIGGSVRPSQTVIAIIRENYFAEEARRLAVWGRACEAGISISFQPRIVRAA